MEKSRFIHLSTLACGALFLASGLALTGCADDDYDMTSRHETQSREVTTQDQFDGLWVQQVKSGTTIIPHLDIKGNSVVLCKADPINYDYSNRLDGTLIYNARTQSGVINFSDGSELPFVCDDQGNFCDADTVPYYKIDNTLDGLQALNVKPDFTLSKDYVGPTHDFGIDLSCKTLLTNSNLGAGGGWYSTLLKFAGDTLGKGAISWMEGKGLNFIFDCFFPADDTTAQQLENILSQVNEINNKLSEIEQLIKMTDYEEYINQRSNDYCNPLTNYSKKYADALASLGENPDSVKLAEIVDAWHDDAATISGRLGGPMDAAANYMDFLMNTKIQQTNLYEVYDIYTFNCVPWEHLGYDFRESLRGCDLALINSNVDLAILYATIHHWDQDIKYKNYVPDLKAKIDKFMEFCHNEDVVENELLVCQIKGAHFAMDKNLVLRDYNLRAGGMTWYRVGCQFIHGDNNTSDLIIYGGFGMSNEQFRQMQITPDEMRAIDGYYDSKLTNAEILKLSGANVPQQAYGLILNGKTSASSDNEIFLYDASLYQSGDWRLPKYTGWMLAKTHWSWSFKYWFDGWDLEDGYYWMDAAATLVKYRY